MRLPRIPSVALAVLIVTAEAAHVAAEAQSPQDPERPSIVAGSIKAVVLDPTTYAPAAILYESMLLDWKSSQPFFQRGFVEDNPRYTVNGLPHDVAVSYEAGKRKILVETLAVVPMMLANNATSHLIERSLIRRYPDHGRLLRALGWAERISLSALVSYQLSAVHFQQWQANQQLANRLGYR